MPRQKYQDWPLTELSMAELSEALGGCIILEEETKKTDTVRMAKTIAPRVYYKYSEDDTYIIIDRIKSGNKVADIAKEFGTDACSVSRLFRNRTGQTVKEYKRMKKLKTA